MPPKQINDFVICNNKSNCIKRLAEDEKFAVAISRQYALNNLLVLRSELYCFDDKNNIQNYLVSSLVRSDSPQIPKINQIIQYSLEAGLFVKWKSDSESNKQIEYRKDRSVQVISLQHLLVGFILYFIGMTVATGVLILERTVQRKLSTSNGNRFWTIMDKAIDDNRYTTF